MSNALAKLQRGQIRVRAERAQIHRLLVGFSVRYPARIDNIGAVRQ